LYLSAVPPASSIPLASDARERFLLAIAEQVSPERIAEIHFFPPIRQGTLETGVAVVAATAESHAVAEPTESPYSDAAPDTATSAPARHVVYTARYRWTRKGPERGRWESEIVAVADAPLVTVEAVVSGVRDRSNEVTEPERITGDAARALIEDARCRTTP
jgi:hypothetical protein